MSPGCGSSAGSRCAASFEALVGEVVCAEIDGRPYRVRIAPYGQGLVRVEIIRDPERWVPEIDCSFAELMGGSP